MVSCARALAVVVVLALIAPLSALAAPQAPVRVAVFDNNTYVDETSAPPSAEARNVRNALVSLGFVQLPFTGITAADFRAATNAADVLLIPELEVADLNAALAADARQVIRDFVAAGGVLIVHGDFFGRNAALLNATFGFATAIGVNVTGTASTQADPGSGTRFLKGPASVPGNNGTTSLAGLPVGTRVLYQTAAAQVTAGMISVGAGKIIFLAWDWFDGVPTGGQDGGWLDLLRRAVLEGRAPTRRIALFDDAGFVDTGNTFESESDNLQATLTAQDDLVTTFTGTAQASFDGALGFARRPNVDVLEIPELEAASLAPALPAGSVASIKNFVANGGTLIVHGDFGGSGAALLNLLFGYATASAGQVNDPSDRTAVAGTLFVESPATLPANNAVWGLNGLPVGAKSLYQTAGGVSSLVQIPFGEGTVFFVGSDWYDTLPVGSQDGGWLGALDAAVRTSPPARRAAVWNDPAYVNSDVGTNSEQVNMRASLASRGHVAKPFQGISAAEWSNALAGADVLVVPDLETADPTPVLNAIVQTEIADFVKRGGLLVISNNASGRAVTLLNSVFGFALALTNNAGPYNVTADQLGTPFTLGPASLPIVSAVRSVTNLPPGSRSTYANGADTAVLWTQVGAGHVLVLGWDWFNALPGGGAADGGWVDTLDLAVQSARSRARKVALLDDPIYVDSSDDSGAESDNEQATLTLLDHRVTPFVGITEADFRSALAGADALVIPENELTPLAAALTGTAGKAIRDFVAAGGALVIHSFGAADTLNAVFGGTLAENFTVTDPLTLSVAGQLGTRFAGGPPTLLNADAVTALSTLPFGGKTIYSEAGGTPVVGWTPYGLGRIITLGYDWFDAKPVGTQDGGWVDVLDRAIQEARPRSRTTAVFDDPAFTDTSNSPGSESDTMQAGVVLDGHVSKPFVGITPAALSTGLAKSQALFVPDLEVGALGAALTGPAAQVLRDYVARGGTLVTSANQNGNNLLFLNTVYGLALTGAQIPTGALVPITASAAGTTFAGGPAQLTALDATVAITGGLPANASVIYAIAAQAVVTRIPYGAGEIDVVGWDGFGLPPYQNGDAGQAAWYDVLGRALDTAPPYARRVAVFADPGFVGVGGTSNDEGSTMEALLLKQEHAVVPFVGTTQGDFDTALARADVLLIPEQEVAALAPALGPTTRVAIRQFVSGGGDLVVNGTDVFGPRSTDVLNAIFATALGETFVASAGSNLTASTVGTQFAGGPASLLDQSATSGVTGLPAVGARTIYLDGVAPKTPVAMLLRGYGRAVYLGYDYFDAAPLGATNDPSWADVLDRAVREGAGGDADADGFAAGVDNCPITADPSQVDNDADGVGNACDSCTNIANPRVTDGPDAFLDGNVWATLSGAQRDDDHDGFGNKCDAKFPGVGGPLVGPADLVQFRASNGKNRANDLCGTIGTRPCAIYDLDETGPLIAPGDLTQFRALNGKAPGPKCATCPLPCSAGPSGTCN